MAYNMLRVPAEYAGQIRDLLRKLNSTTEGPLWLAAFHRFLRKENPWPTLSVTISIGIDTLISKGSYRRWQNWLCEENAPAYINAGKVIVEYLDLGGIWYAEDCLQKMKTMGYRPAQDPELLAHDIRHPEQLVSGNPVVVLGSTWRDQFRRRSMVLLERRATDHWIELILWSRELAPNLRFAAVKIS